MLAATADTGINPTASAVFTGIGRSRASYVTILGDLAYEYGPDAAQEYCDYVHARVTQPVAVLPGNHEGVKDGRGSDYAKYTECFPDVLHAVGDYDEGNYYIDRDGVRYIALSPRIDLSTGTRTYAAGTPELAWVETAVRAAQKKGLWTVVGMHEPCLSGGVHGCASSPDLTTALIRDHVDIVLSGHDHNYSRSYPVTGTAQHPEPSSRGRAYRQGSGTVFATIGNGGHNPRKVEVDAPGEPSDPDHIWAVVNGVNSPGGSSFGHVVIDGSPTTLGYRYIRDAGAPMTDRFTVRR